MAWNESGNGKNPWERGGRNSGPPDLDKIVREWQQRLSGVFGGGRGGRPASGGGAPGGRLYGAVAVLLLLVWAATGLYRVDAAERGVVTRFGAFQASTQPGLRWHLPWPIERVEKVNVAELFPFRQETQMLTADENIIIVDIAVQYRRTDPVKYLFNVRDTDGTLRDVSESAIREVVGKSNLDFVLTEGREQIAADTRQVIQQTLDEYQTGIVVTTVNLQDANFPSQVEAAVQDAIKAREDRERLSFEAQAYANDVLPRARGEAVRRMEDAQGYRARVVATAEGETSRFDQLLDEYQKAPQVTRQRLYLEALENVYARSAKIVIDAGENSDNLIYLPVDKLLEQRGRAIPGSTGARTTVPMAPPEPMSGNTGTSAREDLRTRGGR